MSFYALSIAETRQVHKPFAPVEMYITHTAFLVKAETEAEALGKGYQVVEYYLKPFAPQSKFHVVAVLVDPNQPFEIKDDELSRLKRQLDQATFDRAQYL